MKKNSNLHLEVLTPSGEKIIRELSAFTDFYLAGGTALALQLGHRISVDFDLFSSTPPSKKLLAQVEKKFSGSITVAVNTPNELTLFTNHVKITFLHYPFPVLQPFIMYEDLKLLSAPELAATKAYTIGRRGAYRDYIDLYFALANHHATLNTILQLANQKYDLEFNDRLFLEQLVYLDDLEETDVQFLDKKITKNDLKKFLKEEVKNLAW